MELLQLFQMQEDILLITNLNNGFKSMEKFLLDAAQLPKVVTSKLIMLFTQLDLNGTFVRINLI